MADQKVTALTALTGANSAPEDLLTLVDVSDTTMDAAGTNKRITRHELQTYSAGTLTTDVKVLDLSATWNASGVTFTGLKFNVTDTASNITSLLLDLQVGGSTKVSVTKSGQINIPNTSQIDSSTAAFINFKIGGSTKHFSLDANNGPKIISVRALNWASTNDAESGSIDLSLYRDAASILAQRNGTNAQTFRLYNTYTDASNYERLAISWGSNIVSIKPENAGTGSARVLYISGLPTSNPGAGILWNNAGTPAIGT